MSSFETTVVCIGGLADGRRVTDHGDPYMMVCRDVPAPTPHQQHPCPTELIRGIATYRRERILADGEELVIYVSDNLRTVTALSLLIGRYPSNQPTK